MTEATSILAGLRDVPLRESEQIAALASRCQDALARDVPGEETADLLLRVADLLDQGVFSYQARPGEILLIAAQKRSWFNTDRPLAVEGLRRAAKSMEPERAGGASSKS